MTTGNCSSRAVPFLYATGTRHRQPCRRNTNAHKIKARQDCSFKLPVPGRQDSLASQLSLTEELQDKEKPCSKSKATEMMVGGAAKLWYLGNEPKHTKGFAKGLKDILEEREDVTCQLPLWTGRKQT